MNNNEEFKVTWNTFHTTVSIGFRELYHRRPEFVDLTLACEGKFLQVHRVVLSICSPYLRNMLVSNPCRHPTIFLKDVKYNIMAKLLEFMYCGSVNVCRDELQDFLDTGKMLEIAAVREISSRYTDVEAMDTVPNAPSEDTVSVCSESQLNALHTGDNPDDINRTNDSGPTNQPIRIGASMSAPTPMSANNSTGVSFFAAPDDINCTNRSDPTNQPIGIMAPLSTPSPGSANNLSAGHFAAPDNINCTNRSDPTNQPIGIMAPLSATSSVSANNFSAGGLAAVDDINRTNRSDPANQAFGIASLISTPRTPIADSYFRRFAALDERPIGIADPISAPTTMSYSSGFVSHPRSHKMIMLSTTTLLYDKYSFVRSTSCSLSRRVHWICKSHRETCFARCVTERGKVIYANNIHNHPPHRPNIFGIMPATEELDASRPLPPFDAIDTSRFDANSRWNHFYTNQANGRLDFGGGDSADY